MSAPKIEVCVREGRHHDVVGRFPFNASGLRRAEHCLHQAWQRIEKELQKAPAMQRDVWVTMLRP